MVRNDSTRRIGLRNRAGTLATDLNNDNKNIILEDLDRLEIEREQLRKHFSILDLLRPSRNADFTLWQKLFAFAKPYVPTIILCLLITVVAGAMVGPKLWLAYEGTKPIVAPEEVEKEREKVNEDSAWYDKLKVKLYDFFLDSDQSPQKKLTILICLFLAIVVLEQLLNYISSVMIRAAGHRIIMDVRNELFAKVMSLSLRFHNKNHSGKLISRITGDIAVFGGFFTHTATEFIQNLTTFVFCIILLLTMGGGDLFLFGGLIFIIFLPIQAIGRQVRKSDRQIRRSVSVIYSQLAEALSGQKVIKAFSTETEEFEKFKTIGKQAYRKTMKSARLRSRTSPVVETMGAFVVALLIWYGGTKVIEYNEAVKEAQVRCPPPTAGISDEDKALIQKEHDAALDEAKKAGWSFPHFLAIVFALVSLIGTTRKLAKCNNQVQAALASADRVGTLLYSDPEISDVPEAIELEEFEKEFRFNNIYYEYEPGVPVLKEIDLTVEKGRIVALVGPSGAGKTTFVDLIPRFYDVVKGSIEIDGNDIRKLKLKSLRKQIGIVSQETFLFSDTVRMNIAYGSSKASNEQIIDAAKAANAHEFIMEMENGYDTEIGERGVLLSGGQRQRIAIARALLKNPPILILDEATSALDSKAEALVQEALFRLMEGRTTFVIAHRLSTVRKADIILVFNEAHLVERGTHNELLERNGLYARLHELQTKWPGDELSPSHIKAARTIGHPTEPKTPENPKDQD